MMQFDRSDLGDYDTSEMLEKEGIWMENFPGGRAFRVRRAGGRNKKFAAALRKHTMRYRHQRGGLEGLDFDVSDAIMRKVYAESVIVDWRGIKDVEGNAVQCTRENVIAFFETFPEIFRDVMTLAGEANMYAESRVREAEEALGNA